MSELTIEGMPILYLDRATVEDPSKSVRGGIPVLFPFAGKLIDDRFLRSQTLIKQHGFGRNKIWTVSVRNSHLIRATLVPDSDTRAQYPFEFVAEQTVFVLPRGVQIELLVENTGSVPFPVSPGWHPYFSCPAHLKGNVSCDVPGCTPDRLSNETEFDFGLPAPSNGRTTFAVPELGILSLAFSPEMRHLQFWSLPKKDFICIEPFFGKANTANTEDAAVVHPGFCKTFWMRICLDPWPIPS